MHRRQAIRARQRALYDWAITQGGRRFELGELRAVPAPEFTPYSVDCGAIKALCDRGFLRQTADQAYVFAPLGKDYLTAIANRRRRSAHGLV
jgi:hypothetical protein